jgi:hypothetical protein
MPTRSFSGQTHIARFAAGSQSRASLSATARRLVSNRAFPQRYENAGKSAAFVLAGRNREFESGPLRRAVHSNCVVRREMEQILGA